MKEMIRKNHERAYLEYQMKCRKEKRQEKILTFIIGLFMVLITIALIVSSGNQTKEAVKDCVNGGHEYNYCVRKLA